MMVCSQICQICQICSLTLSVNYSIIREYAFYLDQVEITTTRKLLKYYVYSNKIWHVFKPFVYYYMCLFLVLVFEVHALWVPPWYHLSFTTWCMLTNRNSTVSALVVSYPPFCSRHWKVFCVIVYIIRFRVVNSTQIVWLVI